MFLLIQFVELVREGLLSYLHSTMFLLIPSPDCHLRFSGTFTFHYVSTYTNDHKQQNQRGVNIYIPLCFYLYEFRIFDVEDISIFTFHYVSTYTDSSTYPGCPRSCIYIPLCFYLYKVKRIDFIRKY